MDSGGDVQMAGHTEAIAQHHSDGGVDYRLHPLVLINMSDHYTRTRVSRLPYRVLGCLLGQHQGRTVDISNSFEMQLKDESTSAQALVNTELFDAKLDQYKQNFSSLEVVGWYTIGSGVQESDMHIHKWFMEKMDAEILLTMDPSNPTSDSKDLPLALYESGMHMVDGAMRPQFVKASYSMDTSDAERIGVNTVAHILPTGAGGADSALAQHYSGLHSAMEMLSTRIKVLLDHLKKMQAGEVQYDHKVRRLCRVKRTMVMAECYGLLAEGQCNTEVMRMVAGLLHKLPTMQAEKFGSELMTEFTDASMVTAMCLMTKGVDSCHELVCKSHVAYEDFLRTNK